MTIKRYAGDKLVGLSSDTKPINLPDGATFYETDTLNQYIRSAGSWNKIANTTFENIKVGTSGLAFANSTANVAFFVSNGNVGIGTISPSYKLDVDGEINSSGTVYATHFDNVSDINLKENIETVTSPKDIIQNLNPVSFTWKDTGEKSFGLIAQEVEKILPEIVHSKSDNTKTVSYIQLIPFLIQIIKEQQEQIDYINNKLDNA